MQRKNTHLFFEFCFKKKLKKQLHDLALIPIEGMEFLKRKLMNARASEIQFMKPINSKKNNKHAFHGKGENKLTFVEPILLPSFVAPQNLPRYSPSKESQRVVGFCNFGEGRSF